MNPQQKKTEKKKLARLSGSGSRSNEGKPAGPPDDSGNSSTEEDNKGTRGLATGPNTSILRQALQGLPIKPEEPKGDENNTRSKAVVPSPTRKNIPAAFPLPLNPTDDIDPASGSQGSALENPSELAELPSPRTIAARPRVSPKRKPGSCVNQDIVSPSKILRRELPQEISPKEFCSTAILELGNASSETASTMTTVISSDPRHVPAQKGYQRRPASADYDAFSYVSSNKLETKRSNDSSIRTDKLVPFSKDDRFKHMALNLADKFRMINCASQQFYAEMLIHMILIEALEGTLTKHHRLQSAGYKKEMD